MNKREVAIASVHTSLSGMTLTPPTHEVAVAVVDNLIHDGIINLSYAGDPEVSLILDSFQFHFGTTAVLRTDRYAASRLGKRHGVEEVCGAILALSARASEKYAPVVNNLTQLEQKWPAIQKFLNVGEGQDV